MQPKRAEAPTADQVESIADVLARVRMELEEIARRIDRNQSLIAKSTWNHGASDAEYVKAMQDADLSAQRIAGLADYIHAIAQVAHPHWHVETNAATATLTLAEMARAMSAPEHAASYAGTAEEGEVDFF